jgi:sugar lactone lactonase YvrE
MARQHRIPQGVAVAFLVAAVAGCAGGGAPTALPPSERSPTAAPLTKAPATPAVTDRPAVTVAPVAALELLWEAKGDTAPTGSEAGTFSPAVNPITGDIWVSTSSETIWTFDADGTYKGSFGEPGDGRGEFAFRRPACPDCPIAGALAFAPDGTLFVADVGNHRVQRFDPSGTFVSEWGSFGSGEGQFADAMQIATNGQEVFVADHSRRDTQVFDLDGKFLRALPISGWHWLAVDADGSLYVSNEGKVVKYASDGTETDRFDLPDYRGAIHPGLAVDDRGRIYCNFQDNETAVAIGVGELDPMTGESRVWSTGGETLAVAGGVVYQANYAGEGWPEPMLRAYALTAP